jgi:glycosyltransferase involved in cell wall biosynthesis
LTSSFSDRGATLDLSGRPALGRPLRVLHVVESLGFGGAEQNLLSILRCLPADRFEHHLAWLYQDERLLEAFAPLVSAVVRLDGAGPLGLVRATARLTAWLRRHPVDVVHTQLVRAQLVGRTAAVLAGRLPVVTTWQNVFYDDQALSDFRDSRLLRGVVRLLDRTTGRVDRHFIAVSEHVAAQQARSLGVDRSRVSVIFNSVAPERYQAVPPAELAGVRRELGLTAQQRVLLAVGRLVEQKAHRDLIDCMPAVLARHPEAVLVVAGAGPLRDSLWQRVEELGLSGQVRLLGARRDVSALYQMAELFVFPSRYEGLSVALVEALANGLPAVVSDIPQNREIADGVPSVRFVAGRRAEDWTVAIVSALASAAATPAQHRDRLRHAFSSAKLASQVGAAFSRAAGWSGAP